MTQPVTQPLITGTPIITAPPANLAEPTMEELAALVPEPEAEALTEYVKPGEEGIVDPTVDPAAEPKVEPEVRAAPEAPTEVDAALERAEAAAKKAREGSRRYKETQARVAQEESLRAHAQREAEQLRRETAAAREREAAYLKDPYGELKKRGMTDVQLAERAMRENTPEALLEQTRREVQEERAARIALEKRIEDERADMRAEAAHRQAAAEFIATAKDAAEAFPELAAAKPERQVWAAQKALAKIQAGGHQTAHFTNEMIVEAAGRWLANHLAELGVKPAAKAAAAPARPAVAKPSGVTLTNKQAQTRTVAAATWDQLTDEQQIAHIAAGLPEPGG